MSDAAPVLPRPVPRFVLVREPADARARLRGLLEARPPALGVWVHAVAERGPDAEDYRTGSVALLALARDPQGADAEPSVVVFDVDACGDLDPLVAWMARDDAPYLVFHAAHAALFRLGARARDPLAWAPTRLGCTQTAATLLTEGTRRHRDAVTIEECTARLLHQSLPTPTLQSASGHDAATVEAIAARADALLPLMQTLAPMLRRRDLAGVHQLECRLLPAVVDMERVGVGVDAAGFERVAGDWRAERETATAPERIARLDKLISTYAYWPQEFIRNDRIFCRLHPLAADSGRFACTDPNLQQVPSSHTAPGLRACFRAPAGSSLVVADYAQIELRVAAHLAPCDAMRQVFREGRDPHRATAATITGKPEAEISVEERKLAKAVNFGFLFGMGAKRFRSYARDSYGVELDEEQARQARQAFLSTFGGIAAWHRRVAALGHRSDRPITVRTAMGRRKRFEPGKFSFNAALNIPVQGTAAEGFKRAMIELRPALRDLGGRGVLCVHDEYLAEVPSDRAEQARALVQQIMQDAMASLVDSVPILVEARVAPAWSP